MKKVISPQIWYLVLCGGDRRLWVGAWWWGTLLRYERGLVMERFVDEELSAESTVGQAANGGSGGQGG